MTAKEAILNTLNMGNQVVTSYLSDLSDDDLLVRSTPEAHHIAWQLGHLIISEHEMLSWVGCEMPALPEAFEQAYTPEASTSDDPANFHTKDEYLAWHAIQRGATLAALAALPEADLDKPGPEKMREYCPTVGHAFNLVGLHQFMHSGQFVPVRRKLGKPILI